MRLWTWTELKEWLSLRVMRRPVIYAPRDQCEHNGRCVMCPEDRCVGFLNDPHDPDLTKPRVGATGHCTHVMTKSGPMQFRLSMEGANSYYAKKLAADRLRHDAASHRQAAGDELSVQDRSSTGQPTNHIGEFKNKKGYVW